MNISVSFSASNYCRFNVDFGNYKNFFPLYPLQISSIKMGHQNLKEAKLNRLFSFLSPTRGNDVELRFDKISFKLSLFRTLISTSLSFPFTTTTLPFSFYTFTSIIELNNKSACWYQSEEILERSLLCESDFSFYSKAVPGLYHQMNQQEQFSVYQVREGLNFFGIFPTFGWTTPLPTESWNKKIICFLILPKSLLFVKKIKSQIFP